MRRAALLLVMLSLLIAVLTPSVRMAAADEPAAIKTFSGVVPPDCLDFENCLSLQLLLAQNFPDFLFYYKIIGGTGQYDLMTVYIEEIGEAYWGDLTGEGWIYCNCTLNAGTYHIVVESDVNATLPLSFTIGFYLMPQPPVEFSGRMPAQAFQRTNGFRIQFVEKGIYQAVLGVTSGSYELFLDDKSAANVTQNMQIPLNLTAGLHMFEVSSEELGVDEEVGWSVLIQKPVVVQQRLYVRIVKSCPTLNFSDPSSVCVTSAATLTSDGSTPKVNYTWSATAGTLNSTTGQTVEWRPPVGEGSFTLTVEVSSAGYLSSRDSLVVQVIPEFPSGVAPFLIMIALAMVLFARGSRKSGRQTR